MGLVRSDVEGWFRRRAPPRSAADLARPSPRRVCDPVPGGWPLPEPRRLAPKLPTVLPDFLDGASMDPERAHSLLAEAERTDLLAGPT